MSVIDSKERNSTRLKSRALSNVQMELIKLYSTNLGYDDLLELKNLLANHFAQKAINEADNVWNKKGLSENTMEDWLNEAQSKICY